MKRLERLKRLIKPGAATPVAPASQALYLGRILQELASMNLPDDAPVTEPVAPPATEPMDAAAMPTDLPTPLPTVVPATVHDPNPLHIAHEDHDHDPSNPHYFGLPVGVIIAAVIATISVAITILKFFH